MPVEIEDNGDAEATKQRESARRLFEAGELLMVCKTALLGLEWVMRGYYGFDREDIRTVFEHVLSLPHVHIESQPEVEIGVPPRRINEIVHGKRAVTAHHL